MILAAVLTARSVTTFQWLERAPLRFLGRVSYSIYLLHLTAIYIVAQFLAVFGAFKLGGIIPQLLLAAGTLTITMPLAWMLYTLIELPAIRLGKTVGGALAARLRNATYPSIFFDSLSLAEQSSETAVAPSRLP
jgi:peptidoglycan/LPS O-acetylase OafA/YrhL